MMNATNYYPKMTALCRSFPTLDHADGVDPFDAEKLDAWACSGAPSHGGLHAARFALSVWSGQAGGVGKPRWRKADEVWRFPVDTHWRCGVFDLAAACGTWDDAHRRACARWVVEAWYP